MHSTDTKHQFVTLRARGLALGKISEQLDVPKSTLGRWQSDCEEEIQQLQRIEWEEIEAQYGYTLQDDLRRIMKRMRAAEDQLDARNLERFTRRELLQLIRESRREYEKKRALLFGTPKRDKMVRPPIPDSETSLNRAENPPIIQPFPNQNNGGSTSAAANPWTSPAPCVETDSENPSGIRPLPHRDQRGSTSAPAHNANLTPDRTAPCAAVEPVPSAPSAANVNAQEPKIENPNSDIAEPPDSESDFGGESVPINAFESTREWLERQGIHVSKVPKGARIIRA